MNTTTAARGIRRAYAINQWKPNFDDFTRREQHLRAFKVIVAAGFTGVELRAGTGRWDALGRPDNIAASYGSTTAFVDCLHDLGIEAVSSYYFDPGNPIDEDLSHGRSMLTRDDHVAVAEAVRPYAEFLAEAGGARLVVRPLPAAWSLGQLTEDDIAISAEGWNQVGAAIADLGIKVSLHADCLGAAADPEVTAVLLEQTDPAYVGLTIDTAELTVADQDPVEWCRRFRDRIDHLHLKDTRFRDEAGERLRPHADFAFLQSGGMRGIERWFYECGTPGGLVDFPAALEALGDYNGWTVFESDQTPNPASSVMMNGWYARQVLGISGG